MAHQNASAASQKIKSCCDDGEEKNKEIAEKIGTSKCCDMEGGFCRMPCCRNFTMVKKPILHLPFAQKLRYFVVFEFIRDYISSPPTRPPITPSLLI